MVGNIGTTKRRERKKKRRYEKTYPQNRYYIPIPLKGIWKCAFNVSSMKVADQASLAGILFKLVEPHKSQYSEWFFSSND